MSTNTLDQTASEIVGDLIVGDDVPTEVPTESAEMLKARKSLENAYNRLVAVATKEGIADGLTSEQVEAQTIVIEADVLHGFIYSVDEETRVRAINQYRVVEDENGRGLCIVHNAGVEFFIHENAGGNWSAEQKTLRMYDKFGTFTHESKYTPNPESNSNPDLAYFRKNVSLSGGRTAMATAEAAQSVHVPTVKEEKKMSDKKFGQKFTEESVAKMVADASEKAANAAVAKFAEMLKSQSN